MNLPRCKAMAWSFRSASLAILLIARIAVAQSGEVVLRHLNHTAWTAADVPALHGAYRIARSNDGYLWINARNGVLRFDGIRFALLDSAASPLLKVRRDGEIQPVLVDRSGTLWLYRADHALITYRDGTFRLAIAPDTALPTDFMMDGAGRILAYGNRNDKLFELRDGHAIRLAPLPDAMPTGASHIVADTGRGMWVGSQTGLWHVVNGRAERLVVAGGQPGRAAKPLVQTRDGAVWATGPGVGRGLERIVNGKASSIRAGDSTEIVDAYSAIEDNAGAVWISTHGRGVLLWQHGRLQEYTKRDGLSDVLVYDITVDARGVAIMATAAGLDRLRPTSFVTLDQRDGIPVESPQRVLRDESGALWTRGIDGHALTQVRTIKTPFGGDSIVTTQAALPLTDSYELLGLARNGGVWVGTQSGEVFRYRDGSVDRRMQVPEFAGASLRFVVEQRNGDLWIGREHLQIERVHLGKFVPSPVTWATDVLEDSRGHLWVADANAPQLDDIVDGRIVRQIGRRDGLPGFVGSLAIERDDRLWAMTDSGLVRIAGGHVAVTHAPAIEFVQRYGPELESVAQEHLWFASDDRIGRISLQALNAAANSRRRRS